MRRRILWLAMGTALVAVVVFGVPLGLAVRQLYLDDERGELERLATRIAATVSIDQAVRGDRVELPRTDRDISLATYDASGRRVSGAGPRLADRVTRTALDGGVGSAALLVAVPVTDGRAVTGAVRAANAGPPVLRRTIVTWGWMCLIGLAAVAVAGLVATQWARRVAGPLRGLSAVARSLGGGDLAVRWRPSGLSEVDEVGGVLVGAGERMAATVRREREFTDRASHQLRTPLTGVRLALERALDGDVEDLRASARTSIEALDRLDAGIDELLALGRGAPRSSTVLDLAELPARTVAARHGEFAAAGRPLRWHAPPGPVRVIASAAAVDHVLTVLLDNALLHGSGATTLAVATADTAASLSVRDQGPAHDGGDPSGHRVGLPLAEDLAAADGGRLTLVVAAGGTVATVWYPLAPPPGNPPPQPVRRVDGAAD